MYLSIQYIAVLVTMHNPLLQRNFKFGVLKSKICFTDICVRVLTCIFTNAVVATAEISFACKIPLVQITNNIRESMKC